MKMKLRITTALLPLLLAPSHASADALCNYDDTVKMDGYLKKARQAEKDGRTRDALLYYMAIDSFCGDGVSAASSMKRIGLKYGERAAARGRFISDEGLFRKVEDEECRRWVRHFTIEVNRYDPEVPGHCTSASGGLRLELNPLSGAFDWYESTASYREADLAMLKAVEQRPEDFDRYEKAYEHFRKRGRLNATGYKPDPLYMKELEKTAVANLNGALASEEKEYAALRQAGRSVKILEGALKWASVLGQGAKERVIVRAVTRADAAFQSDTPAGLLDALIFLSFADRGEEHSAIIVRAAELGQAALARKDYELAEKYFIVAGNEEMAAAARKLGGQSKTGVGPAQSPDNR